MKNMSGSGGKPKEIALGNDFGDVAVTVNGVLVEVHTDGSIAAYTNRSVDAYTNGPVQVHPAANDDTKTKAARQVGDKMPDGSVYAGISPDTYRPMYATQADAPLTYTFNQAQKYAAKLDVHGHQDWRVPTINELNVLFQNCAAIGGFDESGSYPAGWYWSSSQSNDSYAWNQRFSDGNQYNGGKVGASSLRCVRGRWL
jgi:hypothetical protein